jgi:hypothetical protein
MPPQALSFGHSRAVRRPWRLLAALLLVTSGWLTADRARAEVFHLANEGTIRGELLNKDEIPRKQYIIATADGGQVTLDRAQVVKVAHERPEELEYERIRPTYPDTVEGQWKLAEWCRENKLGDARKVHLERIIELDPEHLQARRALGYGREGNRWVTQEQLMTERGYKFYKGKWVLPQEIVLEEQSRKVELAEKEWIQRLKRWRGWLENAEKTEEARRSIRDISDPFAVKALSAGMESEKNERVRVLYAEALGRIGTPGALGVLVDRSLIDPDEDVRLQSLDELEEHKHPDLTALFVKGLKHKENAVVNRAAMGLARMGDPSAVRPLIDALITTHKFVVQTGQEGQTTTGFARDGNGGGGGGISLGASRQVISQKMRNEAVRDALVTIAGVNYDFEVNTWLDWYAAQKQERNLNGRRD